MITVIGYDVGGANTKAALLQIDDGKASIKVASQYFPIWKTPHLLPQVLLSLNKQLGAGDLDAIGVTMTAELSDAYQTKREGVIHILGSVQKAYPNSSTYVLNSDAQLLSTEDAENNHLYVSSANWAATGWLIAKHLKNAVVIDVGSTSTSIIPIVNGKIAAKGKTDLEKLLFGELVYTGSLRTNIAAIVHSVPIRGGVTGVSSELFATSGDVHLILGHISAADFSAETADGRGKTDLEAKARLSRVICADVEMLTDQEILELARYIYNQQIKQVVDRLSRVYRSTKELTAENLPIVVTGLGKDFLARKAAESIGVDRVVDLAEVLPSEAVLATPAVGVAFMAASKILKEPIRWP
ncbi:H4MPT-linked C1 transfer pathway protein [Candidatus Bathyarchaeota archaeon]|nr:H4MPT-linked C1 transfer pathway protein [Candidatus Bathyarchaeota archaeon]